MGCLLIEAPPEFTIRDGFVHIEFVGSDLPRNVISLRSFRICLARAQKLLAAHDATSAKVFRMGKPEH